MALSKKPVNGMKDILPQEMEIRDYVTGVIKDTYRRFGFTPIETPCMENIANLSNKQGGENEKLIFKVLKRVEKLGYSCRNHCNYCLYSKHVDKNPGDRQEECHGLLEPIGVEISNKKGYVIIYKCKKCGAIRKNKAAKDDNMDLIIKLSVAKQ